MNPKQFAAKIIKNKNISGPYYRLTVDAGAISRSAVPGQFVMIKSRSGTEPLLRRPLSIHGAGQYLEFLYEVVGEGTGLLSQKKPGDSLDIVGPLGNGFDLRPAVKADRVIITAGGIGAAPLLFLASRLGRTGTAGKIEVLIGGRASSHILCAGDFKKSGCGVGIATDDGSKGYKGRITGLLNEILSASAGKGSAVIYACGPKPMLKAVCELSGSYCVPAQVSLESHMACGIGACLGCVVETISGCKRVCKDGPVFHSGEIIW